DELARIPASAVSLHLPDASEPAEHPPDLTAVVMVWCDDAPTSAELASWFTPRIDAYLVDERIRIPEGQTWPDGVESPGVGRLSSARALPGLSRDEMAQHWGTSHWPIARVHHPALCRYIQNVVVDAVTPDAPALDGIAELRFRSISDLRTRFY